MEKKEKNGDSVNPSNQCSKNKKPKLRPKCLEQAPRNVYRRFKPSKQKEELNLNW